MGLGRIHTMKEWMLKDKEWTALEDKTIKGITGVGNEKDGRMIIASFQSINNQIQYLNINCNVLHLFIIHANTMVY